MEVKVSPQPKVNALLRIIAGTCVLFWLMGIAVCDMGHVCSCVSHGGACTVHTTAHEHAVVSPHVQGHSHDEKHHDGAEIHEQAAASRHHHDGAARDDHGCKGNQCGGEQRCCSTIQAIVVTPAPIVAARPVSPPALHLSLLCVVRESALSDPSTKDLRQAKPRDWVFTPEVFLGPAFHSLAPPPSFGLNRA